MLDDTLIFLNSVKDFFLGISIDVYALILIPTAIFIAGNIIQIYRENSKETNRIDVLRKYILIQYEELIKDLENSLGNISNFMQQFNKAIFQNLTLKTLPFLHYKNIINLDQTDKYKVFISGKMGSDEKKIKLFDSLEKKIYAIDQLHMLLNQEFKNYMFKINTYNDEWGKNVQQIEICYREFVQLNKSKNIPPNQDPFLNEFDLILYNWTQKDSNRDIQCVLDLIINPLHDLCNKYKMDQRREIIINNIIGCLNAYDNMINLRSFFKITLDDISNEFIEFISEFNKELKIYKNLKAKRIKL